MAKMTNPITVTLDPEIMDLIRDLRATVDLYVAHTENLIERVYALEGGDEGQHVCDPDLCCRLCGRHAIPHRDCILR